MPPLVIAHAACAGHAPENTLAGIRAALDLGADAIDVDVQATADSVPVLMHDLSVDRTTNGSGPVTSFSWEELRRLDAGDGEGVPSLAQVLQLARDRTLLICEIKQPGIESLVAEEVRRADALGGVMVWSFFPQALESMRRAEPRLPCGLLVAPQGLESWPRPRELAIRLGVEAVSLFHQGLTEDIVTDCHRRSLTTYAWTADAAEDIERLLQLKVDGIVSNYPERVRALLAH